MNLTLPVCAIVVGAIWVGVVLESAVMSVLWGTYDLVGPHLYDCSGGLLFGVVVVGGGISLLCYVYRDYVDIRVADDDRNIRRLRMKEVGPEGDHDRAAGRRPIRSFPPMIWQALADGADPYLVARALVEGAAYALAQHVPVERRTDAAAAMTEILQVMELLHERLKAHEVA